MNRLHTNKTKFRARKKKRKKEEGEGEKSYPKKIKTRPRDEKCFPVYARLGILSTLGSALTSLLQIRAAPKDSAQGYMPHIR